MTDLETILSIGEPALLEQLAEECSELEQAALKLARLERGESPTPKAPGQCLTALIEEVADVKLCVSVVEKSRDLNAGRIADIVELKEERWAQRIREARNKKPMERSYRKRPVVVKAYQTRESVEIETLEGVMHASPGDWIITGVNGEKYPCKPDVFVKTYVPAEEKNE